MTSEHKYRVDLVSLHCLQPIIKQQIVTLTHVTNHSGIHHNSSFPLWEFFLSKYMHIHTNLYSAKNREISVVCSLCAIAAAVPPRPQDGTACFSHRTLHRSVQLCDGL